MKVLKQVLVIFLLFVLTMAFFVWVQLVGMCVNRTKVIEDLVLRDKIQIMCLYDLGLMRGVQY